MSSRSSTFEAARANLHANKEDIKKGEALEGKVQYLQSQLTIKKEETKKVQAQDEKEKEAKGVAKASLEVKEITQVAKTKAIWMFFLV